MRILILSLNYAPEPTGFAPHTTALAEHLVAAGHGVVVVTGFPFAPRWSRHAEYRGEFIRRETVNGVHLVRVSHFVPRRPGSALQRIAMEATFGASALLGLGPRGLFRSSFDLALYVGAQPAIAWTTRTIAAMQGVPYLVKITDLAAQAASDVGIVRNKFVARWLNRVEFGAYRGARGAVVLCDAFKKALVEQQFTADTIHLIPDSVDLGHVHPGADPSAFRRRHGIRPEEFVVLYSGSLGLKQGLFDVVEAARLLARKGSDIRCVLVGEGETRNELAQRLESAKLEDRVLLLPLQPEAELSAMFAAADVLLLSQVRAVKDTVIPSKLLMYMAAGRPILSAVNAQSQAAAILRDAGGGVVIPPEDARAMADALCDMRARPDALAEMGRRNRVYAEQHFDRTVVLAAQQKVIEGAIDGSNGARPLDGHRRQAWTATRASVERLQKVEEL